MNASRWLLLLGLAAWLAIASSVAAQQSAPRIGYIYPAGSRQGAELDLVVGGRNLQGITTAYVSGSGVQTFAFGYGTVETAVPAIAETVTVRVTIAADAEPGQRELRLETPAGLTNPLVFTVGQLPEFREKPGKAAPQAEMSVALPAILNGRIMPGEVDRYRFPARKGERLVFSAAARELVPYLPDAVPGWFQAVLALYDAQGNELAYADDFRFIRIPILYYEVPQDGQYVIEIRDALYRGREDFVYRLAAGELPCITSIFPLGGKAGDKTSVELQGWNLPVTGLVPGFPEAGRASAVRPQDAWRALRAAAGLADRRGVVVQARNRCPARNRSPTACRLRWARCPKALDQEPNNAAASPQPVTLPLVVNGRIDPPGDWDVFRFPGRAGDQIVAEVQARRLQLPAGFRAAADRRHRPATGLQRRS